jgi:hypothetical protein
MSIRLDPRRLGTLKHLAGEAGVRPGDLVRQWVEERIDASRGGTGAGGAAADLVARLDELDARIAALEAGSQPMPATVADVAPSIADAAETEPAPAPAEPGRRNVVSAAPREPRVALHDEMIAVLRERGPMSAADLARAVAERGRYAPPRSGKPLDAAMVSQRVSNPTYRPRFTRSEGRIGLADEP